MDVAQVASSVLSAWGIPVHASESTTPPDRPPPRYIIEQIVATAFEASLLQEENRSLNFRLALRDRDQFPPADGLPSGVHRLVFSSTRPFTAHELRRLSPAVDYDRSLLGLCVSEAGQLEIWGVIRSGPGWLEKFRGGRGKSSNLPDCLIVGVRDPGRMIISRGSRPLCTLEAGVLQTNRVNVFNSSWLPAIFATVRAQLLEFHTTALLQGGVKVPFIDPRFPGILGQQMLQRLISTVQRSRHGGTLLIVPASFIQVLDQPKPLVRLKYRFAEEEPRARLRSLIVQVMNALTFAASARDRARVGWNDYVHSTDRTLFDLDESIFEMAHFVGTLTAVDGAVVVTRDFDLLGFGGEIAGALEEVESVAQAADLEGLSYRIETTEEVGTRHRSVYRLCSVCPDVLGIVVSQDGSARFIRRHGDLVMYWDHSTVIPQ